jgi:hypothetical protein
VRDSCGKSASRETPQAQAEEARGKRVPGAEINVQIVHAIKKTVDKLD